MEIDKHNRLTLILSKFKFKFKFKIDHGVNI
jgi:hypothetical protein